MVEPSDTRRGEALEAAFGLFLRFGYRKTSMDEIARAVGISRQGLYLWFPGKEALFKQMVDHLSAKMIAGVAAALEDPERPLDQRLVDAFDVHTGAFVGSGASAGSVDELLQASRHLVGDRVEALERDVLARLASALAPCADDELSVQDLAEILYAVSIGTKYRVPSREAYRAQMRKAVRAVCGSRGSGR